MSIYQAIAPSAASPLLMNCGEIFSRLKGVKDGDFDVARDHMRRLTGGRCNLTGNSLESRRAYVGAEFRLGNIRLQYNRCDWASSFRTVTERHERQDIVIYLPLRGGFTARQLGQTRRVDAGTALVVSTAGEVHRSWEGTLEQLNIVIPQTELNRLLAVDYFLDQDAAVTLDPMTLIDASELGMLLRLVESALIDAGATHPILAAGPAAKQLQNTILHAVLRSLPHSQAEHVAADRSRIAPFYIRRAEAFIAENFAQEISIEDLTRIAGVSPRTIYYGFKQYRQMTPLKYLKRTRLNNAREELSSGAQTARVSEVSDRNGYANASQFSRDYKTLFGESPIETLKRASAARRAPPADDIPEE